MESLQRKRRKILLLFLLGVGVPSLALGYLAFRGIRNELAVQEQRRLDEHRAAARLVSDTVVSAITSAEQAVATTLAGNQAVDSNGMVERIRGVTQQHALIEEIFLLDDRGTIRLPAADLLYHPDGSLTSGARRTWPASAAANMQTARQQEFQRRQYAAALTSYRSAFTATSDPVFRGEALIAITRVQRKAGQSQAALSSCETLATDFRHVRTTAGTPLGPTALSEKSAILLASSDSVAALSALLELYEGLVAGEWTLERAQYDLFDDRVTDAVSREVAPVLARDSLASTRERLAALRDTERGYREQTERLLVFLETAGEDLTARAGNRGGSTSANGARMALESNGNSYLVSLVDEPGLTINRSLAGTSRVRLRDSAETRCTGVRKRSAVRSHCGRMAAGTTAAVRRYRDEMASET